MHSIKDRVCVVTGAAKSIILSTEKSSVGSVVLLLFAGLIRAGMGTTRLGTARSARKARRGTAA